VPLSNYDKYFGGKPGSAAKAKRAMMEHYGAKKGESVFYAKVRDLMAQGKGRGGLAGVLEERRRARRRS
jgi:hypothetical protein